MEDSKTQTVIKNDSGIIKKKTKKPKPAGYRATCHIRTPDTLEAETGGLRIV